MRWLGWLVILAGIASLAVAILAAGVFSGTSQERGSEANADQAAALAGSQPEWRRTADGWQRATWLSRPIEFRRPVIHPAFVGLLLTLLVLTSTVLLREGAPGKAEGGRDRGED